MYKTYFVIFSYYITINLIINYANYNQYYDYIVPKAIYQFSHNAFLTTTFLFGISSIFENTYDKRRLASACMVISIISCYCDYKIVNKQAFIIQNALGNYVIVDRYLQWSVTTPLMIYLISQISYYDKTKVIKLLLTDWSMIMLGLCENIVQNDIVSKAIGFLSMICFYYLLYNIACMMYPHVRLIPIDTHKYYTLLYTMYTCIVIWHMFPLAAVLNRLGGKYTIYSEVIMISANLLAKVVFSSCLLFNNYTTIDKRIEVLKQKEKIKKNSELVIKLNRFIDNKKVFLNLITYEMTTPLKAIVRFSKYIKSYADCNPIYWANNIIECSNYLKSIIEDIVSYKSLSYGITMNFNNKVCIEKLIHYVINHLYFDVTKNQTKVKLLVHKPVNDITIYANEKRLAHALSNIIGNSIKYTQDGYVDIFILELEELEKIKIIVKDTGCGMSQEYLKRISIPFDQRDMSITRRHGGIGISLSITKMIIQYHNGSLDISSEEGKGTTVEVTLPINQKEVYIHKNKLLLDSESDSGSDKSMNYVRDGPPSMAVALSSSLY